MAQIRLPGNLFSVIRRRRERTYSEGDESSHSFEVIRARYSFQAGLDSLLDEGSRVGDLLMTTEELEDHLLRMENIPAPPPNSPITAVGEFEIACGNSQLSLLSNLLFTNPSLPYSSYRESSSGESGATESLGNIAIIEASSSSQSMVFPTPPEIRPVPTFVSPSKLNPSAEVFTPGELFGSKNTGLTPSVYKTLLTAFSAPSSPEENDPNLQRLRPGESSRVSVIRPVRSASKVTSRAVDRPANQWMAMDWTAAENTPLPKSPTGKRLRTLSTSTCGPDLNQALSDLINERKSSKSKKQRKI